MKKEKVFHYVYKIENLIDGRIYIGAHSTNDMNDGYMGSCIPLKKDIVKYGKGNFKKIILNFFNTKKKALAEEKKIVNKNFVNNDQLYNMRIGGNSCKSGYGIISAKDKNGNKILVRNSDKRWLTGELVGIKKGIPMSERQKNKISKAFKGKIWVNKDNKCIRISKIFINQYLSKGWIRGRITFSRKPHSEHTRRLISIANSNKKRTAEMKHKNSLLNRVRRWIHKDKETRFVNKNDLDNYLSTGWKKGRGFLKASNKNGLLKNKQN